MKRRYERPSAYIEEFTPNEYVAACGDNGTVYKFVCNAGEKKKKYDVYYYDQNNRKTYLVSKEWGRYYHPCKTTHEAKENTGFINGFIDDQKTPEDEKIQVVIWTNNGTNVHCTTELDMSTWQTAKS